MGKIIPKQDEIPAALRHIQGMNVKAIMRQRGAYLRLRRNQELKEAAKPLAAELVKLQSRKKASKKVTKTIIEVVPQKYISFSDDVVASHVEKTVHNVETLEQHFEESINKFLINTLLAKCLENLPHIINDTKADSSVVTKAEPFNEETKDMLINEARIQLEPLLQNMASIAGQDANKLIGLADPYIISEALRKHIQSNVAKFTESMVETDQKHLIDLIIAGIEKGQGVPEISSGIKSDFTAYSAKQSTLITRTEVMRSATQASVDAFRQSGVVQGKQWVIAGAVDNCADYDGDVVTLDGNFYTGSGDFQDGNPPLHPNCKCVLIPVLEKADESS